MHRSTAIEGVVAQVYAPAWAALEDAVTAELAGWFMWMHEVQLADGSRLQAYKHVTTRKYLHLSEDGRAYEYRVDGLFGETALAPAIARAFRGWERALPPASHHQALRAAINAARGSAKKAGRSSDSLGGCPGDRAFVIYGLPNQVQAPS